MKSLTMLAVANNYQATPESKPGTLVIFEEKHEKGELKDKQICYFDRNPEYQPMTRTGWTFNEETGRVNVPVVTRIEEKVAIAQGLAGIEFSGHLF